MMSENNEHLVSNYSFLKDIETKVNDWYKENEEAITNYYDDAFVNQIIGIKAGMLLGMYTTYAQQGIIARIERATKRKKAISEMASKIADMALNGASNEELESEIKRSIGYIDGFN